MKELTGETELKLSKTQLQNVINDHIQKENGLNDLFALLQYPKAQANSSKHKAMSYKRMK